MNTMHDHSRLRRTLSTGKALTKTRRLWSTMAVVACASGALIASLSARAAKFSQPTQAGIATKSEHDITEVRRFAVIVGANMGGAERATLRYAGSDAKSLESVLAQVGGVGPSDRHVLVEPTRALLQSALRQMAATVESQIQGGRKPGDRLEFVFYYSGHSDEQGLLIGDEVISYADLRAWIAAVPTDVHVAILDSCASGAFTRIKGGTHRAPFLLGGSGQVRGHAFLASSSADEAAQESDRIGGSFFTHYLVSGLRGAADVDGDQLVTINEAYLFARNETLARTQSTQAGAQHAAYDLRLAGTGDLVMTDLRQADSRLTLLPELTGRVYVRNSEGRLVAELYKVESAGAMTLALEAGSYQVSIDDGEKLWEARLEILPHQDAQLSFGQLRVVQRESVSGTRGDTADVSSTEVSAAQGTSEASRTRPEKVYFSFVPPLEYPHIATGERLSVGFAGSILYGEVDDVDGVAIAMGVNRARSRLHGWQTSLGANFVGESMRGAQTSLGMNHVGKSGYGVQGAIGLNIVASDWQGGQAAVGTNTVAGKMDGMQAAVGANFVRRGVFGMQAAVGFNVAGEGLLGAQAAVGANIATDVRGIQAAAGVNIARHVEGVQATSGLNIAESFRGVQAGIVNATEKEVRGVQLGLINFADEADVSIGLIPYTKKGGVHPEVWTSDIALVNVGLRFDAKYTYMLWTAGVHPFGSGEALLFGLGLGVKIPIQERSILSFDILSHNVVNGLDGDRERWKKQQLLSSARLMYTYQFAKHFSITGGPTVRVLYRDSSAVEQARPGYGYRGWRLDTNNQVRLWPGFAAGVRF